MAAALALLAALPMTGTALASDRSLHLHAVSHGSGRVAASAASTAPGKLPRHAPSGTRKPGAKSPKPSAHKSKSAPSDKAHGKTSRRHRHEPEAVDDPITVHRAETQPLSRKAAARERLLAREHESSPHRELKARRGHTELAETKNDRRATSGWAKGGAARNGSAPHQRTQVRSIVLADTPLPIAEPSHVRLPQAPLPGPGTAADSSLAASERSQAYRQGESHPDDDGDILSLQSVAARQPVLRSVVVRSQPGNEGEVSAAPATNPAGTSSRRVITGFGAEVAVAPVINSATSDASATAPTQQQQMDIADDTESEKLADTSPRALAEDAMRPMVLPVYTRNGRLLMPAPLRGSREILVHQNTMADRDGLQRIRDDRELNRLRSERLLVTFPESASLRVNYGLPENRRYARPWTVRFAADAARAFYARFGEPLQVNSAVRTVAYQVRLQRVNGNAAATRGDGASPHLTGQAIDLAKRGMTSDEIGWMRTFLLPFIEAGKIDVEEEFQQACFHISVYRAYLPAAKKQAGPKMQVAQLRTEPRSERTLPAMPPTNGSNELNDQ